MRAPHGYLVMASPEGVVERDTAQCCHCGRVVVVKPGTGATVYLVPQRDGSWREVMGASCRLCLAPVCLACHAVGTCLPFERRLERQERASRNV